MTEDTNRTDEEGRLNGERTGFSSSRRGMLAAGMVGLGLAGATGAAGAKQDSGGTNAPFAAEDHDHSGEYGAATRLGQDESVESIHVKHLHSDSQSAEVVLWVEEDGDERTVHADGEDGSIASGTDAGAVIQAVHDEFPAPESYESGGGRIHLTADEYNFESGVEITKNNIQITSDHAALHARSSIPFFFKVGNSNDYPLRTGLHGHIYHGHNRATTAIKVENGQMLRISGGSGYDMTDHFIHAVASSSFANLHHWQFVDLHTYRIPLPIKMSSGGDAMIADGEIIDCHLSIGPEEFPDREVGGILLEDVAKVRTVRNNIARHEGPAFGIKLSPTDRTRKCVGNAFYDTHLENVDADSPGPTVHLKTRSDGRPINQTTITNTYAAPTGSVFVKVESNGPPVRNTRIDGLRNQVNGPSPPAIKIGDGCFWTRISGTAFIGGRGIENIEDNGNFTVINGYSERNHGILSTPSNQYQPGDQVRNLNDGAVYQLLKDGTWQQLKPTDKLNLSDHAGSFDGQVAHDDGTNTAGNGLLCVWDAAVEGWQASDGSATFGVDDTEDDDEDNDTGSEPETIHYEVANGTIAPDGNLETDGLSTWTLVEDGDLIEIASGGSVGGQVWMSWDGDNLYFQAAIDDPVHLQTYEPGNMFRGDNIQIGVAPGGDGWGEFLQYTLARNDDGTQVYGQLKPSSQEGSRRDFDAAIVRDDANEETRYEVAIPWTELDALGGFDPASDEYLRVDWAIMDADGARDNNIDRFVEWDVNGGSAITGGKEPDLLKVAQLVD